MNERLELETLKDRLAQWHDRAQDTERRRLHLEKEIRFYDDAISAEAQIQTKLKHQNREIEQELRGLQNHSAELKLKVQHHEKKDKMVREEAEASLQIFIQMNEDLELALTKLKNMEILAKQLTEVNYNLRVEQHDEKRTAYAVSKENG